MSRQQRIPYLIQRMTRWDSEGEEGVDSNFMMDYMGSSEFEWGALPRTLEHMRASEPQKIIVQQMNVPLEGAEFGLWYAGRIEELELASRTVEAALDVERVYRIFKERPHMRERLRGEQAPFVAKVDGWWAVNPDHLRCDFVGFAIFIQEEYAWTWKECILGRKSSS